MILNIVALLLVLAVTFLNSMFGFYSGLLNVFCCVVALAVAFGYGEALSGLVTSQFGLHPGYTEPLALAVLFSLTLIVLRVLADKYLRGNVKLPMYVDWAGGAVCGFVIGQICVGVMVICFLMLPWGGRALMYSRYERQPDDVDPETGRAAIRENSLWLRSDEFVSTLFGLLSRGSLKGATSFASVYPDYAQWVAWSGNTVQGESLTAPVRDSRGDGYKEGLSVVKWWEDQPARFTQEITRYRPKPPTSEDDKPPFEPRAYRLPEGKKLLGVRLTLRSAAVDRDGSGGIHRFRPSMIRLVGDIGSDGRTTPAQYIPQMLGGADTRLGDNVRIVDLDNNLAPEAGELQLDAFFAVDQSFRPRFVEYRRHARAELGTAQYAKAAPTDRSGIPLAPAEPKSAKSGASASGSGGGTKSGEKVAAKTSGASRFIDTVWREGTGGTDRLPFAMSAAKLGANYEITLDNKMVASGKLVGEKKDLAASGADAISKLKAPEGKRLFQVATKARQAKSLLGKAMHFAGSVGNQYRAMDASGNTYDLAGYYALIKRDGQEYIELYYYADPAGEGFNGLLAWQDSGVPRALEGQEDAVLGLIFQVPPGTGMRAITSQGGRIDFGETMTVQ
jgi:hypothetical protein